MTVAEIESDIRITTDTPYLALMGEPQSVYCEDLGENWQRYNGRALYLVISGPVHSVVTVVIWKQLLQWIFEWMHKRKRNKSTFF